MTEVKGTVPLQFNIDWALKEFRLECILLWLEPELNASEMGKLEKMFKKFLYFCPKAWRLVIGEYRDSYGRAKEAESRGRII